MTEYAAIVRRTESGWSIHVPAVDRHTWASRLREVEDMARDLVQVMTDKPIEDITVDIQLPPDLDGPIRTLRTARGAAADADAAAREAQRAAATTLRDAGATLRDIAVALGISYQRVHQVLADAAERAERLERFSEAITAMLGKELSSLDLIADEAGDEPIITALGDELLTELVDRLRVIGGYANVFVLSRDDRIRYLAVVREEDVRGRAGDDLTGESRPGETALIDTFIDYLALHPSGVTLDAVGADSRAQDARTLEMA